MDNTNNEDGISIAIVESETAVQKESQFSELNKLGFVRVENAEDQWQILINEAWGKSKLPRNDTIAIYLSKMLT